MTSHRMLEGIRIVDLTSIVFGPYATEILADLGAEVIKVEPLSGDLFRHAGQPKKTAGMGPCNMALNHGKRSLALDLKNERQSEDLRQLIRTADVFIHNVRGKAIERLGFGFEAVKAVKDDIIYVHCVGFGSEGPYADLQAYDDVIQAATGTATLLSRVDGDPRPRYLPSLIADKVAGMHGAYAILAAIIHKLRTGEGQFVEVPMFEAFTHFMMQEHLYGATFVPPTYAAGYPRQLDPNRQPFPTADGYISIVPYTDQTLVRLFSVLGAADILAEESFSTPPLRAKNMTLIYAEIAKRTPARTTGEWIELLSAADLPAMPVRDLNDILEDPHLQQVGFFRTRTHPTEGDYIAMRAPVRFSAMPAEDLLHPPLIGQDNETLLPPLNDTV